MRRAARINDSPGEQGHKDRSDQRLDRQRKTAREPAPNDAALLLGPAAVGETMFAPLELSLFHAASTGAARSMTLRNSRPGGSVPSVRPAAPRRLRKKASATKPVA